MRLPLAICLTTLALAACNKPATPAAPKADAGKSAAAALGLPERKAGIWEIKMDIPGMPAMPGGMRRCFSGGEVSGDDFRRGGRNRDAACTPQVARQLDGSLKINGECDLPNGGHSKTEGVVSGDFTNHYRADITSIITGTGSPMDGERKMSMEANWLGPCPAGVEPGTMLDANNKPMSAEDVMAQYRQRREARRAARDAAGGGDSQ